MKKILVIEDNESNLYLLQYLLEKKGYNVIIAKDGVEGVSKAINEEPVIILMDISLPRMNGYEATRILRKNEKTKETPIIAVTSFAMTGDQKKCIEAGCTDYIEKPIDPEQFYEALKKYLTD